MVKRRLAALLLLLLPLLWHGLEPASIFTSSRPMRVAEEGVIVAFGDSLTAGFGVTANEAYPSLLMEKLQKEGLNYRVVNAGVSGETTAGGLRRIDWILKRIRPDIVILELGANDGLRGLDLAQMGKNLAAIIERFQEKDIGIVLAGMKIPPNYGKDYTNRFEATYPNLAERYRIPLIPFFLEGVAGNPFLNQADGIHPTASGYKIIVDRLWPLLKETIERHSFGE